MALELQYEKDLHSLQLRIGMAAAEPNGQDRDIHREVVAYVSRVPDTGMQEKSSPPTQ